MFCRPPFLNSSVLISEWFVEKSDSLYGITPQCRPKKNGDVVFFSCLFEVKFLEEIIPLDEETCGKEGEGL